jgi:hypothetical protein
MSDWEGEAMKYKDGETYTFTFDGSTVHVRLQNFRPEVVQKFNKVLAKEKLRCYRQQQEKAERGYAS